MIKEALTFDDVLILPNYSEILPSQVNVSTALGKELILPIPVISAAMDTITEQNLAIALARLGALGCIHKNMTIELQAEQIKQVKQIKGDSGAAIDKYGRLLVAGSVGVSEEGFKRAEALVNAGADVIIVDSAHGHSKNVLSTIEQIKNKLSVIVIGGNIATANAANALIDAGADLVKVGIGPGSICTTRIVAGIGVPQLTAIMSVAEICKQKNIGLIADGGMRYSGDFAKAIAGGATIGMMGRLFAGCDETPGELVTNDQGNKFKYYRGMGSVAAMKAGSKDRYGQQDQSSLKLVPEGVESMVPYKGNAADVLHQLIGGLKASMAYTGSKTIADMHERAEFVKITGASLKENHPHNVEIINKPANYS